MKGYFKGVRIGGKDFKDNSELLLMAMSVTSVTLLLEKSTSTITPYVVLVDIACNDYHSNLNIQLETLSDCELWLNIQNFKFYLSTFEYCDREVDLKLKLAQAINLTVNIPYKINPTFVDWKVCNPPPLSADKLIALFSYERGCAA